jgi:hypothetical protein
MSIPVGSLFGKTSSTSPACTRDTVLRVCVPSLSPSRIVPERWDDFAVVAQSGRALNLLAVSRIIRGNVEPRDASAAMDRAFGSRLVMTGDQLARSSTERLRLRAADSEPVAQLLHLATHCFFGERGLVEVRSSCDVAVPLRSDFACGDFRIYRGKPADKEGSTASGATFFAGFSREHNVLFYSACRRSNRRHRLPRVS